MKLKNYIKRFKEKEKSYDEQEQERIGKILPKYQKEMRSILDKHQLTLIPVIYRYGLDVEIQFQKGVYDLTKKSEQRKADKQMNKIRGTFEKEIAALNKKYKVQLLPFMEGFGLTTKLVPRKDIKSEEKKTNE